jgi:hypothetical protein
VYGGVFIGSSVEAMKMLLEKCHKAVFANTPKIINEADNCEGVLILQNLILTFVANFPKEYWENIIESMDKRLKFKPILHHFLAAKYLDMMC